ncbi:MAG TPA: helix-turn-helix transcriptional regulator [Polyangiales bacterium]|jgi:predicted transcriptional regulator|nr:helix-turn-helix transcriptional regulator [Polyangiales bacterium]
MKSKTWQSVRDARLSPEARARVNQRVQTDLEQLTLRELRQELELTQQQVADKADMTQSELSRLESRTDHRVSTLRRYVEAMGGELEISVVVGKRRLKLTDIG